MPTCLIVQPIHPAGIARLEEAGITCRRASAADMETVAAEIPGAVAAITRDAGLSTAALDAASDLLVIANHGIGTNKIDVAHAGTLGIPIVYTPSANARSVAELAITMMLALMKRLTDADAATRAGDWRFKYSGGLGEAAGKTLGLVGFGTIAKLTGEMGRAFGMRVVVFSPSAEASDIAASGAQRAGSLDDLLAVADVVSLHRPARPDTVHTLNAPAFAKMKPGALVINTARGTLIDEPALAEALASGKVGGAGLDVFETEPLPAGSPILSAPNVILSPHCAGSTEDALRETALQCAEQIIDVLAGRRPPHLVKPEVWERRRGAAPREAAQ